MRTRVECINCKKMKRTGVVMLQMHVLVGNNENDEDGGWEEVERVPVCLKCLADPVTAMTAISYLTGGTP